jgi:hypothetical protein
LIQVAKKEGNLKASKPQDSRTWRDSYLHKLLGLKSAKRVERVLPMFEKERPKDKRPRNAVEAIEAWSQGRRKLGMKEVRQLSLAAHAAARDVKSEAARSVAHAAGQAVGTWHVPTHALGAFEYAGRAFAADRHHHGPRRTTAEFAERDLEEALRTLSSMISKIGKAQAHFGERTPQYTLAKNRLKALRMASTLIRQSSKKPWML